jgi:hypothetical protein
VNSTVVRARLAGTHPSVQGGEVEVGPGQVEQAPGRLASSAGRYRPHYLGPVLNVVTGPCLLHRRARVSPLNRVRCHNCGVG